ncbi:DUF998 domain-containing protein [Streptomyces sp. NPDC017615]|uniref:DUF998 domain-containing protein n=1 Tax=Streptomyces sp. NPDC017615 TaxID=3365003 RepID=UPI0037A8F265
MARGGVKGTRRLGRGPGGRPTWRVFRAPSIETGMALLAVWGLGLVVAAVVPTDALTTHLSGSAYVHRYASVAAFVALPSAALLLARRLGPGERRARSIRVLGWAAPAGAAVMACSANLGDRELIGLVERVLLGCEVTLLGVLALYAREPRAAGPVLPGRREIPERERLATRGREGTR